MMCQSARELASPVSSISSSFSEFSQRNEAWELQRQRRLQETRRRKVSEETSECSFQPALVSKSAVAPRKSHKPSPAPRLSSQTVQWCEERERNALAECSFQPNLSKSARSYRKVPVCATASADVSEAAEMERGSIISVSASGDYDGVDHSRDDVRISATASDSDSAMASSTFGSGHHRDPFTPSTNDVPPKMLNAKTYLKKNVFNRLSQSVAEASPPPSSRQSCEPLRASLPSPSISCISAPAGRSRSEANIGGGGGSAPGDSFTNFLHRQNVLEADRKEKLSKLEVETAPTLRPQLCERSIRLAERQRRPQRPASAGSIVGGRGDAGGATASRTARVTREEAECTFKPKITKEAAQRDPRGLEQLSAGDMKRRQDRLDKLRTELKKREPKDETFAPEVQEYNGVKSRLRLRDASDNLLERMERMRNDEMKRCEFQARKSREKEEAELTFKPQVRPAPEFVRRMAESYRMVRAMKEEEESSSIACESSGTVSQPDWR
eukprot:TRINITY_DN24224_c0_g1_i1.p1 TRINITY_DN24224_c0_g1~~TRINITY_DN24224_c0_g1_i1.p1  ORF type:complete len:498 (+),score=65.25 TRINITY_DN24224_c0_g1_i1:88-1581(+)